MEPQITIPKQRWFTANWFLITTAIVLTIVLIIEGYFAICRRDNDFLVHREFGQAFLAGQPWRAGQFHYLPSRGMINALTAWLPYRLDRAFHFATAIVGLAVSLFWWNRLVNLRQ